MEEPERITILFSNGIEKTWNDVSGYESIHSKNPMIKFNCKDRYGSFHTKGEIIINMKDVCFISTFKETEPIEYN